MPRSSKVPTFKLYGEAAGWPTPELLHCESIFERSSLHGWHIRVHQHAELVQMLYLQKGQAEIMVEGETIICREASLQVVPALCVHGFRFSPGTQGYVLSLSLPLLGRFEAQFGRQLEVLNRPGCLAVKASKKHIDALFATLLAEYQQEQDAREMMLHAMLSALLVWLNRQVQAPPPAEAGGERKRTVMRQFARLIESHYREHLPLAEYARRIGLSVTHLNTLCRELHGCSALGVLHRRLMLEAERSLRHTSMSVQQIADFLGFSDATYFSRFFRRYRGEAPGRFRQRLMADS